MIVYKNLLWIITNSWDYGTQVWVTNGELKGLFLLKGRKHYQTRNGEPMGALWTNELVNQNGELVYIMSEPKNEFGCIPLNEFLDTTKKYPQLRQSLNDCVYVEK